MRLLRALKKLDQLQLAKLAGISQSTVCRLEKGLTGRPDVCKRIAAVLDVAPIVLFPELTDPPVDVSAELIFIVKVKPEEQNDADQEST